MVITFPLPIQALDSSNACPFEEVQYVEQSWRNNGKR